jgi:hypothetical protein
MLKAGDKVKKKNGTTFSNGEYIATVSKVEYYGNGNVVWLVETGSWLSPKSLEHAHKQKKTEIDIVKEKVQKIIDEKQEKIKSLEDDIKKLNYTLATLEEIDE